MVRYIDAEDFEAEVRKISKSPLNEWDTWGVLSALERVPTADVAPVIHAHWIYRGAVDDYHDSYTCSNCLCVEILTTRSKVSYCWNCGAKMDEEVE